jgi:phenylacetate-coenzyme A ligase PaaK-like adenylate-forming protein
VHTFTGIFEHYPQIKQFQVHQDELDLITILYIKDNSEEDITLILDEIKAELKQLSFEKLEINFKEVDTIKSSPSGKPQIVVSNLKS